MYCVSLFQPPYEIPFSALVLSKQSRIQEFLKLILTLVIKELIVKPNPRMEVIAIMDWLITPSFVCLGWLKNLLMFIQGSWWGPAGRRKKMMPIVANMQVASFPEAIMCSYGLTLMMVGKNSYFWHVRSPVRMNNILPSCMGHSFKTKVLLVTMTMTKIRWLTLLLLYWSRMDDTLPSCWGHVSIAHTVECYESPPGNLNFDQLHIENDGDNIIMLTTDGWIMIVRKSVFYKKRGIPKTVFEKKNTKKI